MTDYRLTAEIARLRQEELRRPWPRTRRVVL